MSKIYTYEFGFVDSMRLELAIKKGYISKYNGMYGFVKNAKGNYGDIFNWLHGRQKKLDLCEVRKHDKVTVDDIFAGF